VIGIVADDITGANDIGAMFAEAGYETLVWTGAALSGNEPLRLDGNADVAIVDTNSRYFTPEDAYRSVAAATRALREAGCDRFFKKTCSVFRGNVGPEFDAMVDTLGTDLAARMIVSPGYPSNNRTTIHGIQYVFDKPLSESHFRDDPVHPTTESNIVEVLRGQTARPVAHVDIEVVSRGPAALRDHIRALDRGLYILFDVPDQEALRILAEATRDERVFGGSAGLASELAPMWRPGVVPGPPPVVPSAPGIGIPVVAGSLTPVTAGQVALLEERGAARIELDPLAALDPDRSDGEVDRCSRAVAESLRSGLDAVLVSRSDDGSVAETFEEAAGMGLSQADAGMAISDALARTAKAALESAGQNRLLAAGGDTSAAVCARLGVRSLRIGRPLEPGLPLCTGFSDPPVRLVLKGGSMGTPGFMVQALDALREA